MVKYHFMFFQEICIGAFAENTFISYDNDRMLTTAVNLNKTGI